MRLSTDMDNSVFFALPPVSVIIVAAGTSSRVGFNKLSALLPNGKSVLENAVLPFLQFDCVKQLVLAVPVGSVGVYQAEIKNKPKGSAEVFIVEGGATRTDSVKNALAAVQHDFVLIHDGARPYIDTDLIGRVINATVKGNIAIPVISVSDSLILDGTPVDRSKYRAVQTPQGFNTKLLRAAYDAATDSYTDDATVFFKKYGYISTVDGNPVNRKITYSHDLGQKSGVGYDIHRMTEGDSIILGGVEIPCEFSMVAHSDGDVLLHAVMDAALTALGKRDIGCYFPDTDDAYLNVSSQILLSKVINTLAEDGWHISNVTAEIIAQKPKLALYIPKITDKLSSLLNIPSHCVGIAATTNEYVGDLGAARAIAVFATVTLSR